MLVRFIEDFINPRKLFLESAMRWNQCNFSQEANSGIFKLFFAIVSTLCFIYMFDEGSGAQTCLFIAQNRPYFFFFFLLVTSD